MPGDLQCFKCVLWSDVGAKCEDHGTADDKAKRLAYHDAAYRRIARTPNGRPS